MYKLFVFEIVKCLLNFAGNSNSPKNHVGIFYCGIATEFNVSKCVYEICVESMQNPKFVVEDLQESDRCDWIIET